MSRWNDTTVLADVCMEADAVRGVFVSNEECVAYDEGMVLAVYNERKGSSSMTTGIVVGVVACCVIFVILLVSIVLPSPCSFDRTYPETTVSR